MDDLQIYQSADGAIQLGVAVEDDSAWLSLEQMTTLFDRDKSVISRHIRNIFKEGKLVRGSVVANNCNNCNNCN
jgi:hypothetical protein